MVDIVGPSGQPLPNPFNQQKNVQADVGLNTASAERALADLNKTLDNLAKNFGSAFQKATAENLQAQENFYKYIGDRDNERKVRIDRLKRAAIDSVNEELKAQIASFEEQARVGKMTQEQLAKEKLDLASKTEQQIANIRSEADKKSKPGLLTRGLEGIQNVASRVGGPIGGMVSGIANLVMEPEVAIPAALIAAIVQTMNARAAFTKTGVLLRQAGLGGPSGEAAGRAESVDRTLFRGLNQALSADDQRAILAAASGSRLLTSQLGTTTGIAGVRGNLGLFANVLPDASKEMELFADASKELATSQKDLTNIFVSSRVNAERLKMTQLDTIKTEIDMAKALRNITNDGAVAIGLLSNLSGVLNQLGTSEAERQRISLSIAQAGGNLSLSTIAGMSAFVNGKMPTPEAIFGTGALGVANSKVGILHNPFELMGQFLSKIGDQFKNNPTARMFAADQLRQQFMPGLRLQDVPQFFNIAAAMQKPGANMTELTKQFEALEKKTPQNAMADGIKTLTEIVGPIKRLENVFTNFWTFLDDRIRAIMNSIPGVKGFHLLHQFGQWVDKNTLHRPDTTGSPTSAGRTKDANGRWTTPH